MSNFKLPLRYSQLGSYQRRFVREEYIKRQKGLCMHCKSALDGPVPDKVLALKIDWTKFPQHFLKYPIHLQHCHDTDLTEGAVHAYCNAVLWQYYGR